MSTRKRPKPKPYALWGNVGAIRLLSCVFISHNSVMALINILSLNIHLKNSPWIITGFAANYHCKWFREVSECDRTKSIFALSKVAQIEPCIILILCDDINIMITRGLIIPATNNIYTFFARCRCIKSNTERKFLKKTISIRKKEVLPVASTKRVVSHYVPLLRNNNHVFSFFQYFSFQILRPIWSRYKWLPFINAQSICSHMRVYRIWLISKSCSIES